jgi:DNA recombination protein RmuC
MATLNTMRAVMKDARMRDEAHRIRRELGLLVKDVGRLMERVGNLDRHFEQAHEDIRRIRISAEKAGNRAERLEVFEFGEEPEPLAAPVAPALETQG